MLSGWRILFLVHLLGFNLQRHAPVDALDSLQDSIGLPRWSVLGYSSGSRVAEAYLQTHPDHVERAIFLCPMHTFADKALALRVASIVDARFPEFGT